MAFLLGPQRSVGWTRRVSAELRRHSATPPPSRKTRPPSCARVSRHCPEGTRASLCRARVRDRGARTPSFRPSHFFADSPAERARRARPRVVPATPRRARCATASPRRSSPGASSRRSPSPAGSGASPRASSAPRPRCRRLKRPARRRWASPAPTRGTRDFFTDAWDSTVGELVLDELGAAPAPEVPSTRTRKAIRRAAGRRARLRPGVAGASDASDDVATGLRRHRPALRVGGGKRWSAWTTRAPRTGAKPRPRRRAGRDAPTRRPPEKKTKKKKEKTKKTTRRPARVRRRGRQADAPAPAYDDAEAPAPGGDRPARRAGDGIGDKTNTTEKREKFDRWMTI